MTASLMAATGIRVLRARANAISFSGKHRSELELWFADTRVGQPRCQVRVRRDRFGEDVLGRSRGHRLCILLQQKMTLAVAEVGNPLSIPELKVL